MKNIYEMNDAGTGEQWNGSQFIPSGFWPAPRLVMNVRDTFAKYPHTGPHLICCEAALTGASSVA